MAHLVDGIQIYYSGNEVGVYDGECKPIILGKTVENNKLLEEFIWLYKQKIEHYKGDWRGMFADKKSYDMSMKNK